MANVGRTWWAHFEFTRINIEPIILHKKIEDLREVGASMSFAMSSSRESQCLVGSEHYIRIQLRRTPRGQPACDRSNYCNRRDHRCHRCGVGRLDAEQQ